MTTKTKAFDAAEFLKTDEAIALFIEDALDSGSPEVFQEAMQVAARARGMAEVARAAGLGRESLYKALKPEANPRFVTVQRVLSALGVTLHVSLPKVKVKVKVITARKGLKSLATARVATAKTAQKKVMHKKKPASHGEMKVATSKRKVKRSELSADSHQ